MVQSSLMKKRRLLVQSNYCWRMKQGQSSWSLMRQVRNNWEQEQQGRCRQEPVEIHRNQSVEQQ